MKTSIHNPKYTTRITQVNTDAVILPKRDWRKIKKEAVHYTPEQQMQLTIQAEELKRTEMKGIESKRTNLIDAEKLRQLQQANQQTTRQMEERELALRVAEAKGNEELDEVKELNAEMMAARVRTIRDAQLQQKRSILAANKEREREEAAMLEAGRKRAVGIYAERERMLAEQRKKGGAVLIQQMEEKKLFNKAEEERRLREIEEMKIANELIKEEDIMIRDEHKRRQHEFLEDCLSANAAQLRRKQREKEREAQEVQMMVEYQKEQAAKEEAYEAQILAAKAEKEKEIAEIRKKQQKMIDTQAQEDELRARRVSEEKERKEREKELLLAKKKIEEKEMMEHDRLNSIKLKQKRLIEIAKLEKAEFERQKAYQEKIRREEEEARLRKQKQNEEYLTTLRTTMLEKEERKREEPLKHLDDQKHLQESQEDYLIRLEAIRAAKIAKLQEEGVPEKYLADIRRKQFVVK